MRRGSAGRPEAGRDRPEIRPAIDVETDELTLTSSVLRAMGFPFAFRPHRRVPVGGSRRALPASCAGSRPDWPACSRSGGGREPHADGLGEDAVRCFEVGVTCVATVHALEDRLALAVPWRLVSGRAAAVGGVRRRHADDLPARGVGLLLHSAKPQAPPLLVDRTVQPALRGRPVRQVRVVAPGVGLRWWPADHVFDAEIRDGDQIVLAHELSALQLDSVASPVPNGLVDRGDPPPGRASPR